MAEIKIWAMDDEQWYAGETVGGVLKAWANDQGAPLAGVPEEQWEAEARGWCGEGFPRELSDADMDRLKFKTLAEDESYDPDGEEQTFRGRLAEMVADGEEFPCFFATRDGC